MASITWIMVNISTTCGNNFLRMLQISFKITYLKVGGQLLSMCYNRLIFKKSALMACIQQSIFQCCYNNFPKGLWEQECLLWFYVTFWLWDTIYYCICIPSALGFTECVAIFSKKGYLFNNAVCKGFFEYLKREETN